MSVARDPWAMPGRDTVATIGARRGRYLRQRVADDLTRARATAGLSVRGIARSIGVSADRIIRAERGDPTTLTIELLARIAPALGLQLAVSLHPNGDPVRDRAHLALLGRLRSRLPAGIRWRTEVPIPIAGDLRAADACIELSQVLMLIEAETRLTDVQAVERKSTLKQRDIDADRLILLVADTPHNRAVLRLHPELAERFPVTTRRCLAALGRAEDPGGDAIVLL